MLRLTNMIKLQIKHIKLFNPQHGYVCRKLYESLERGGVDYSTTKFGKVLGIIYILSFTIFLFIVVLPFF